VNDPVVRQYIAVLIAIEMMLPALNYTHARAPIEVKAQNLKYIFVYGSDAVAHELHQDASVAHQYLIDESDTCMVVVDLLMVIEPATIAAKSFIRASANGLMARLTFSFGGHFCFVERLQNEYNGYHSFLIWVFTTAIVKFGQ